MKLEPAVAETNEGWTKTTNALGSSLIGDDFFKNDNEIIEFVHFAYPEEFEVVMSGNGFYHWWLPEKRYIPTAIKRS